MAGTPSAFLELCKLIAGQPVDPNQGTAKAMQGAVARIQEPSIYDAVFPFIAMALVLVLPTCIAIWVIYRTTIDESKEADEI